MRQMRVLTMGTFDILHPGHLELLRACREMTADDVRSKRMRLPARVYVGLNRDDFVERYKGNAPILDYAQREECLLACRYVDVVLPNRLGEDASGMIREVEPDIIAVGSDWEHRDYMGQLGPGAEIMIRSWNIQLVYVPRSDPPKISSSSIKSRILNEYGTLLGKAIASG